MLHPCTAYPFLKQLTGGDYEGWKKLQGFIGVFFILGYLHSMTVPMRSTRKSPSIGIKYSLSWHGFLFVHRGLWGFFKKYVRYTVEAVKHPNNSTTEVTLRAKKDLIRNNAAGQFLFIRFPGDKALNELHPFTISSAPNENVLRVTIKASGDFTRHLFGNLQAGTEAIIEGAHGMFDYKTGGQKQIWVAGGIGVTPFLSFIRDMNGKLNHDVDFYYTVRHREEAIFVEEIEEAAKKNPRLKAHIRFSSTDGSLTVEDIVKNAGGNIREHHMYMCGPLPMVQAFEKKFLEVGVIADNIHYEEFNFR